MTPRDWVRESIRGHLRSPPAKPDSTELLSGQSSAPVPRNWVDGTMVASIKSSGETTTSESESSITIYYQFHVAKESI
jgi:hypothetical protein